MSSNNVIKGWRAYPKPTNLIEKFDITQDKTEDFWIICKKSELDLINRLCKLEFHLSKQSSLGGIIYRPECIINTDKSKIFDSGWIIFNLREIFEKISLADQNFQKFSKKKEIDLSSIKYFEINKIGFEHICFETQFLNCFCNTCNTHEPCCHSYNGSLPNYQDSRDEINDKSSKWGIFRDSYLSYKPDVSYNQPIGNWNVLSIEECDALFKDWRHFNQSIENQGLAQMTEHYALSEQNSDSDEYDDDDDDVPDLVPYTSLDYDETQDDEQTDNEYDSD